MTGLSLALACACGGPPTTGTLVHEDAVASFDECIVGLDGEGRPTWVDAGGRTRPGPVGASIDVSYDPAGDRLLVVEPRVGGVQLTEVWGGVAARWLEVPAAERAWPIGGGALIYAGAARWRHVAGDGAARTAILAEPRSLWRTADGVGWLGAGHPRSAGALALVTTSAAAPLAAPEVAFPDIPAHALALGGPLYAFVEDGALHLRGDGVEVAHHVASRRLVGLVAAGGWVVAALAEPPLLLALDPSRGRASSPVALDAEPAGSLVVLGDRLIVVATDGGLASYELLASGRLAPRRWFGAALRAPLAGPLPCLE